MSGVRIPLPRPILSGSLAQLVEQLAFNQLVAGSNPARPTTQNFLFALSSSNLRLSCPSGMIVQAGLDAVCSTLQRPLCAGDLLQPVGARCAPFAAGRCSYNG